MKLKTVVEDSTDDEVKIIITIGNNNRYYYVLKEDYNKTVLNLYKKIAIMSILEITDTQWARYVNQGIIEIEEI